MQQDIYSPSLQEGNIGRTKSFQIGHFFLIAFFGGIIGVTVLGLRNAVWLRLERKVILFLAAVSAGLFISQHLVFVTIANGLFDVESAFYNDISRAFGILAVAVYYFTLKKPFKQHLALGGHTETMLGQGLLWIIISLFIEVTLLERLGLY